MIARNEISNLAYTGISIGWDFSKNKTEQAATNKNNTIEQNRIWNVCSVLFDCSGIYTLGANHRTSIKRNVIHDVQVHPQKIAPHNMGLYFDHSSTGITAQENIVFRAFPDYRIYCQKSPDAPVYCNGLNPAPGGVGLDVNLINNYAAQDPPTNGLFMQILNDAGVR